MKGVKTHNITEYIDKFSTLNVAVLGDIMLDRYVRGDSSRLSPEAPVPVLSFESEQSMLGGAGNVASNFAKLGANVFLFGSVGDDSHGKKVRELAQDLDVDCSGVVIVPKTPTTYKERIVSRGQHVVRVDHEIETGIPTFTLKLLKPLIDKIQEFDAVVVSDYAKGVLTDDVIAAILKATQKNKIPLVVDTKPSNMKKFKGATLITPNEKEVLEVTGDIDPIKSAHKLAMELDCSVILTRGAQGMYLVTGTENYSFNERQIEVVDVSGAGDTVNAVAGAMIAVGSSFEEAAYTSNIAAGLAVCKLGTTPISRSELIKALVKGAPSSLKIHDVDSLRERTHTEMTDHQKVVLTNGCFDILHRGHIEYLEEARRQGDFLVVALNSDDSIIRLKGPTRPINKLMDRMAVLAALSCVDAVVSFEGDNATEIIDIVKPNVYVKGGDYTMETLLKYPEAALVKKNGGDIYITKEFEKHSTTDVISKIIESHRGKELK